MLLLSLLVVCSGSTREEDCRLVRGLISLGGMHITGRGTLAAIRRIYLVPTLLRTIMIRVWLFGFAQIRVDKGCSACRPFHEGGPGGIQQGSVVGGRHAKAAARGAQTGGQGWIGFVSHGL